MKDAAKNAMDEAGIRPADIGHLVSVSCTGFSAPGFDIALMKSLGLSPSLSRTNIGFMGCHGVFNGLRAASALCGEGPGQDALVVSVELCSLHYRNAADHREALGNALFSDGAGAAVVSRHVLRSFGNMSSATILFVLHELMVRKGTVPCVSLGFGPGLTVEAALFLG